ncbi:uncharacterized protein LOC133354715 [Lethenteron reissneri]|uniref:uncharacterized protein LOC133354715 n=1 Tax=Lethenteron reissneri TaxID=7753 RepID=UPI002AB7B5FB|nr:uncharacterized protein LOC133354715 [Lethenteron reissneri]
MEPAIWLPPSILKVSDHLGVNSLIGYLDNLGGNAAPIGYTDDLGGNAAPIGCPDDLGGNAAPIGYLDDLGGNAAPIGNPDDCGGNAAPIGYPDDLGGNAPTAYADFASTDFPSKSIPDSDEREIVPAEQRPCDIQPPLKQAEQRRRGLLSTVISALSYGFSAMQAIAWIRARKKLRGGSVSTKLVRKAFVYNSKVRYFQRRNPRGVMVIRTFLVSKEDAGRPRKIQDFVGRVMTGRRGAQDGGGSAKTTSRWGLPSLPSWIRWQ